MVTNMKLGDTRQINNWKAEVNKVPTCFMCMLFKIHISKYKNERFLQVMAVVKI